VASCPFRISQLADQFRYRLPERIILTSGRSNLQLHPAAGQLADLATSLSFFHQLSQYRMARQPGRHHLMQAVQTRINHSVGVSI